MKQLKGLFQIPDANDSAPDDAVQFEDALTNDGQRPRSRQELARWGKILSQRLVVLLQHWGSARVERAALAHALRWDGHSELAGQTDTAFEYCLAWMDEVTESYREFAGAGVAPPSETGPLQVMELIRNHVVQLLTELRQRAYYLQARAADIRISGHLQDVAGALLSLEAEKVATAVLAAIQKHGPAGEGSALAGELDRIAAAHPELRHAPSKELEHVGQVVVERSGGRTVLEWGRSAGSQVWLGVAGNAAYALLRAMFPGTLP
jgi:hypothetical protein